MKTLFAFLVLLFVGVAFGGGLLVATAYEVAAGVRADDFRFLGALVVGLVGGAGFGIGLAGVRWSVEELLR